MPNRRDFLKSALALPAAPGLIGRAYAQDAAKKDEIFADFESGTFDGWTLTGNCWAKEPHQASTIQGISGFQGKRFLCTLHPKLGNTATGKAVSREFTIEKPFINFRIGGGNHPGEACLNLMVDGKVVRTETGNDNAEMRAASWDVYSLIGKTAHFEVVDTTASENRGYVMVDEVRLGVRAATALQAQLDALVPMTYQKHSIPGGAIAVGRNNRIEAITAFGVRSLATAVESRIDDLFPVASITKVTLGTLAALVVQERKILWETRFEDVFPELKDSTPDYLRRASIFDIACNQSGLGGGTNYDVLQSYTRKYPPREARFRFVREYVFKTFDQPVTEPGDYHGQPGWYTLAAALERASDKPLEDLWKTKLFDPIGMRTASFVPPVNIGSKSTGFGAHVRNGSGELEPIPFKYPSLANIYVNAFDFVRLGMEHALAAVGKGQALSYQQYLATTRIHPNGQTPCWGTRDGKAILAFTGNMGGHATFISINVQTGFVFVGFANVNADQGGLDAIVDVMKGLRL